MASCGVGILIPLISSLAAASLIISFAMAKSLSLTLSFNLAKLPFPSLSSVA